jgi:putative peptidoglycan lipid II flippase
MPGDGDGPVVAPTPPSGRHLAILLMLGAIFGKALGFVREILMAQVFGASVVADGFRAAITGTLLPLAMFQNESVPAILIPTHRSWQDEGDAPRRFAALTVALTLVGFAIMLLVVGFGATWVRALVGGFSAEGQATTLDLLQIMALGMPASVMLNVLASGEIALGRSRLTTIRSSLLNMAVIVGLVIIFFTHWLNALAWAFAIAFNGLGAWGLWTLVRDGSLSFRGLTVHDVVDAAVDFWRKLMPFLFVPLADQGNVWMERLLASRVSVGSLASLDYARTITDSAVLFISQPLGLALLSKTATEDEGARIQAVVRRLLVVSAPVCVCLAIFAPDVARLVFARGAFKEAAVQMTSETLRGISVGLWASMIGWVILRMLNRAGRNKTAAIILVCSYMSNLVFNFLFFHLPVITTHGSFILGLGESMRGLVLLGATVVCLGLSRSMIISILLASIPALVMTALGLYIEELFTGTLIRLLLAGSVCCTCILAASALLMPEMVNMGSRRCMRIFARIINRD